MLLAKQIPLNKRLVSFAYKITEDGQIDINAECSSEIQGKLLQHFW